MALRYVNFNQDKTHLGVATSQGFRLYVTDPFNKYFDSKEGDISMLEMLFSTSLVALVLSPRLLRITNTKRHSTICELTFPSFIGAVKMNRKCLVVVTDEMIYPYRMSDMHNLRQIPTAPNPAAIVALSPSSDNNYLAFPKPSQIPPSAQTKQPHNPPMGAHNYMSTGEISIYDANIMEEVNVIQAHKAPLSCIAINNEGTMLATASEKGTIIRVFSIPEGQMLFQFRRGTTQVRITCMAFNSTSSLLCVSSSESDTVHIFKLENLNDKRSEYASAGRRPSESSRDRDYSPNSEGPEDSSSFGNTESEANERKQASPTLASMIRRTSQTVGGRFAATFSGYLPTPITEMWEPARHFAYVKIPRPPQSGRKTVVAMSNNGPQVMVATDEGNFFVFNIDLATGGEGALIKQYSVLENHDKLGRSFSDE